MNTPVRISVGKVFLSVDVMTTVNYLAPVALTTTVSSSRSGQIHLK